MSKGRKENMERMFYQIENINKEIEILKIGQLKLSGMSVIVCLAAVTNTPDGVAH